MKIKTSMVVEANHLERSSEISKPLKKTWQTIQMCLLYQLSRRCGRGQWLSAVVKSLTYTQQIFGGLETRLCDST